MLLGFVVATLAMFGLAHAPAPSQVTAPASTSPNMVSQRAASTPLLAQPIQQAIVNQPVVARVVSAAGAAGVSQSSLAAQLQSLRDDLLSHIASIAVPSYPPVLAPATFQALALSQRIDALNGTTITSPNITGGTITGTDISAHSFSLSSALLIASGLFDSLTATSLVATNLVATTATTTGRAYFGGNVGIGTTSPSKKLEVNGDIALSGSLTLWNQPLVDISLADKWITFDRKSYGQSTGIALASTTGSNTWGTASLDYQGPDLVLAYDFHGNSDVLRLSPSTGSGSNYVGAKMVFGPTIGSPADSTSSFAVFGTTTLAHIQAWNDGAGHDVAYINSDGLDIYGKYKLVGQTVLYASTTNSSTLVGIGAGSNLIGSASSDAALGYQALGNATSSQFNTAVGAGALKGSATVSSVGSNTAIGYDALFLNSSGSQNVAVGDNALVANTSGSLNTAVGSGALLSNASGTQNVGIGPSALQANTTGSSNHAIGYQAAFGNTTGSNNIAFGFWALKTATSTNRNMAIGDFALQNVAAGPNAWNSSDNIAIGHQAGANVTNGFANSFLGSAAGYSVTGGAGNVLLGSGSGHGLTTGSNNIIIGDNVDAPIAAGGNQLNLGNVLYGTGIYSGTSGSLSSTPVAGGRIGVGTSTPWRALAVTGTVGFDGLTGAIGSGSLCLSVNKEVVYNSGSDNCLSSLRATKHAITDLTLSGIDAVAALNSVSFIYNDDASSTVRYGFIAEDTAAVDPHFTTHDAQGKVSGVDDRSLISILVKAVQELIGELRSIETTVASFAESFTTKQLCVADDAGKTCVSRSQLQELLDPQTSSPASNANAPVIPFTDTEAPIIIIRGNNPAQVDVGMIYNDLGATVTDNVNANIDILTFVGNTPINQADIDTSAPATYHINYVATDAAGNTATSTRTVIVQAATSSPSGP